MSSTTILKPVLLATAAICALALCAPVAVLAQYQMLEVLPGEEEAAVQDAEIIPTAPYLWTITISADGMTATGDVPATAFQQFLAVRAQAALTDETGVRGGAPETFIADALAALEAARLLAGGQAGLDAEGWFIEGELASNRTQDDIQTALSTAATPPDQWRVALQNAAESITSTDVVAEPVPEIQGDAATSPQTAASPALDPGNESRGDIGAEGGPDSTTTESEAFTPDYTFQATKDAEGTIRLSGNAPASVLQAMLALDGVPTQIDRFTMNPAAPEGFAAAAIAGLRALTALETGQIVLRNGQWLLSGSAEIDTVSNAAIATLGQQTPGISWNTLVRAPRAIDVCRDGVVTYMTGKAILFPSAGAMPTPASLELLPELAEHLAICPDAPVYVEGHTDADGGAEANLALSIHRAESVVDALIELGVDPARLYAVGYGASLPIAPNATADGKRQNRRIVFGFEDIARPLP